MKLLSPFRLKMAASMWPTGGTTLGPLCCCNVNTPNILLAWLSPHWPATHDILAVLTFHDLVRHPHCGDGCTIPAAVGGPTPFGSCDGAALGEIDFGGSALL